jgi:hypothetical protein
MYKVAVFFLSLFIFSLAYADIIVEGIARKGFSVINPEDFPDYEFYVVYPLGNGSDSEDSIVYELKAGEEYFDYQFRNPLLMARLKSDTSAKAFSNVKFGGQTSAPNGASVVIDKVKITKVNKDGIWVEVTNDLPKTFGGQKETLTIEGYNIPTGIMVAIAAGLAVVLLLIRVKRRRMLAKTTQ